MEQRERDESSSKTGRSTQGAYGSGNNGGKIEEYENEREGADVDSGDRLYRYEMR